MAPQLAAASRETLVDAQTRLDGRVQTSSVTELGTLGEELFSVQRLLLVEPALRRHLTDSSVPGANRSALADQLFGRQLGRAALDTVSELAAGRWSRPVDLVDVIQELARRATIAVAEKDGTLSEVEDELFRFGRILDREPQLSTLLSDPNAPVDGRVSLLDQVLGQKVRSVTRSLLEQTVRNTRDQSLDVQAEELSELAAARRDRYVAHVRTPVALTAQQEQQLVDTLSRLYGRQMSLQIELDAELLGGLVVRVGGEVIDGSVSSRLSAAKRALPK